MRQRGRKSSSFVALRVDGSPPPLQPPAYLNEEERALFAELIAACDTRAFVPSDTPLLVSFVQATLVARSTAHDPDKAQLWERSVKLQATLATRLRLAPQARTDPKTAARQQEYRGPRPWEIRPGEGGDDGV